MASSALVLLLHVGHCQVLLLQEIAWCLIVAAITKPYLRAVTRQVLQNRCPHGVESTSFQEGKPLRGSRQIGHWRGSSDTLKVSLFYVFQKSCWRNSLTVKYLLFLLTTSLRRFENYCYLHDSLALSFWEHLQAKSRWMHTLICLSQTKWLDQMWIKSQKKIKFWETLKTTW